MDEGWRMGGMGKWADTRERSLQIIVETRGIVLVKCYFGGREKNGSERCLGGNLKRLRFPD